MKNPDYVVNDLVEELRNSLVNAALDSAAVNSMPPIIVDIASNTSGTIDPENYYSNGFLQG